jgi:hypothetical protein
MKANFINFGEHRAIISKRFYLWWKQDCLKLHLCSHRFILPDMKNYWRIVVCLY